MDNIVELMKKLKLIAALASSAVIAVYGRSSTSDERIASDCALLFIFAAHKGESVDDM